MGIWKTLTERNDQSLKVVLFVFFGVYYISRFLIRYQYRDIYGIHFTYFDAELLTLLTLILVNPKGIKLIVSVVFLFLFIILVYAVFGPPISGLPKSMIFVDLLNYFDVRIHSGVLFFVHEAIYLFFIFWIFRKTKKVHNNLIDQF